MAGEHSDMFDKPVQGRRLLQPVSQESQAFKYRNPLLYTGTVGTGSPIPTVTGFFGVLSFAAVPAVLCNLSCFVS